ncbi:hypothetical protein OAW80_00840 [Acidimicrobiia bacterium]|nr:hypothetical protein [Acidimicrobiia bacterium]MDA9862522.1 hypothetical protein [Acidimicrobiia bacterium]MDB3961219.1 hypothetical protein [Acidimicrobiia bacterium]MDB3983714.1 hypothetical protein [Acidimicrobiia bacterium]MDC0595474.1 hypothetical protein [Acidimicrobiia bacterium]
MKKSINIGLILFLLFQACSSPENTSEIIENPLPTDPPDLENMPSPPPPGEENLPENDKKQENPPPPQGGDNPPPPQGGDNPPPPQNGGVDIEKAVEILKEAEDEVLECISKSLPTEIYQNIVTDLNPDSFESGIVIACFEDPSSSNNVAQPPAGGGNNNDDGETLPSGNSKQDRDEEKNMGSWYDLSIYEYSASYSVATSNGKTGYGLNETGDILLSGYGFDNAGGANKLNHPVSISANYGKLAVTDRFNNRVLIWNTIPSSNTPPDLVLGQANFTTHNSGTGLNNMDFPGQVIITPDGKVLVADSDNNRVLVWTSFPTSSGQTADYALPITNYVNFGDSWPWGVWSDGTKVVVTATVAKAVLFWNSFPGPSTSPDVVLTSSQVGTPRSILSDGNYVMLGDENANGPCIGSNGTRSTHVWTSWPTSSRDPDACIDNWLAGTIHDSKIYGIAAGGETMYFYDELFTSTQELQVNVKIANPGEGHRWAGGDDGGATVVDGKLFVAEYNGNRISVFDTIPTSPTEKPDWALLANEPTDYPLIDEFIIQNPIIDSNGSMLFVSSDFDRSLSIWKQLPGSSGATPDIVMRRFDQPPWDLVVHGKEIYLAGGNSVFGWSDIEDTINTGNYSFDLNEKSIGNITFQGVRGIAYNGSYFAVADSGSDTIYIWEGVPEKSDNPTYSLPNLTNLGRIDMNDTHLAIGCYPGGSSFKVLELSSLSAPSYQTVPGQDCPSEVSFNEKGFFIPSDDKIIGWNSISDALAGSSPTMSFGGRTDKTNMGTKMASGISWDGYHFWVGEYKFSNRLLGFLPSK